MSLHSYPRYLKYLKQSIHKEDFIDIAISKGMSSRNAYKKRLYRARVEEGLKVTERQWVKKIIKSLKGRGMYCDLIADSPTSRQKCKGFDFFIVSDGKFIAVEAKRDYKALRESQEKARSEITKDGKGVYIVLMILPDVFDIRVSNKDNIDMHKIRYADYGDMIKFLYRYAGTFG